MFTPIVITSRKARKELNHIKSRTSDIMARMEEHKKKVAIFRQQQDNERKIKLQQEMQDKMNEKMEAKQDQKEMMAHQAKMKELEIKRAALNG